jgi:clorobiocin biosynthesis protein CloN6
MARKPLSEIEYEFATMNRLPNQDKHHFYSVGSYNEPESRMKFFVDQVAQSDFKSISYEQFHLTSDEMLKSMAAANERTILTLSPESHDMRIAKLAGRGVYTPDEMERWIDRALEAGIFEIDIWYFIGMPEQDERSVMENVEYCERLLRMFKGKRVVPMLCPMIPFLDPASTFFTYPEKHGYNVFYRTVEEHRRGMQRASLINRCNYETRALPREQLVATGYNAVRRLCEIKGEIGFLPPSIAASIIRQIDDALSFMKVVHEIDCIADASERAVQLAGVSDEIKRRNRSIFFSGVANQAFPINREVGGRWFDEVLYEPAEYASALGRPVDATAARAKTTAVSTLARAPG